MLEALRSGFAPQAIFFREGDEHAAWQLLAPAAQSIAEQTELLLLPAALFDSLAATESPQPLLALLPPPMHPVAQALAAANPLVLVLAGLQDPGNVGALLRSAEALGATAALLLPGTVSPWNPKALRASAGSALRLPWAAVREAASLLREHRIRSYAAVPAQAVSAYAAPLREPTAFWIGNEGAGLSERDLAACDARITLPMPGPVESLNAAVAGSLLLGEAARQRGASHTV